MQGWLGLRRQKPLPCRPTWTEQLNEHRQYEHYYNELNDQYEYDQYDDTTHDDELAKHHSPV